jgi:hypothetical protein
MTELRTRSRSRRNSDASQGSDGRRKEGERSGSPQPGSGVKAYRDYHGLLSDASTDLPNDPKETQEVTPNEEQQFEKLKQDLKEQNDKTAQIQKELSEVEKRNKKIESVILGRINSMAENLEMFSSLSESAGTKLNETFKSHDKRMEELVDEQNKALSHPETAQENLCPPELQSPRNLEMESYIRSSQRTENHLRQKLVLEQKYTKKLEECKDDFGQVALDVAHKLVEREARIQLARMLAQVLFGSNREQR